MSHLATGLFFALVLTGALAFAALYLRQEWDRIARALRGELPVRAGHQPWPGSRVRVTVRYRPSAALAAPRRHARA